MAQDVEAGPRVTTAAFADRLAVAVERKRSQLVVGLDPRLDLLPVEVRGESVLGREAAAAAYARFCCGLVDAVARLPSPPLAISGPRKPSVPHRVHGG